MSRKVTVIILGLVTGLVIEGCAKKEPLPPIEVKPIGAPAKIHKPTTKAFQNGEELTFAFKYLGFIPMATATSKVREWSYLGREAYYVTVGIKSLPFLSFFYKVEDCVESYFDARKLCSFRFVEHLREGRHLMEKETTYDQEMHIAVFNNKMPKRIKKVMVEPNTQDPISALYFIRAQEFKAGKTLSCSVNNHKRNYLVKIKILRKEKIKIPSGTFIAWVAEPVIEHHGGRQMGRATVWFSVDERKIPLLVKAKTPIGPITTYLLEINLRKEK